MNEIKANITKFRIKEQKEQLYSTNDKTDIHWPNIHFFWGFFFGFKLCYMLVRYFRAKPSYSTFEKLPTLVDEKCCSKVTFHIFIDYIKRNYNYPFTKWPPLFSWQWLQLQETNKTICHTPSFFLLYKIMTINTQHFDR